MSDPSLPLGPSRLPSDPPPRWWEGWIAAVALVGLVTLLCFALRDRLQVTDVAMLYLLAVVIIASWFTRGAAMLATGLSVVCFDLGFVPPYGYFRVHDTAFLLTFAMMFVVAFVMSRLTARIRDEAAAAAARERRMATLYDLSRELGNAATPAQVAAVVTRHLGTAVGDTAAFAPGDPDASPDGLRFPEDPLFHTPRAREAARWVYAWDLPAGAGTGEFADLDLLLLPVRAALQRHGVVAIRGPHIAALETADRQTLELLTRHAAMALERLALAEQREQAEVAVEAERLRTTLLSSISHDLRTPLASIEGAGTALLDGGAALAQSGARDLLETIVEESRRMTRMVTNLLDMVRVEAGLLTTRKAWVPLEEVIGVARLRLDGTLTGRPVDVVLPTEQLLVSIDELLMEQVVVNLLENACRYTPPGSPITIGAWSDGDEVTVEVADRGPGVPDEEKETVFRKFHRLTGRTARDDAHPRGTGLGLAICKGVVLAHGGGIWVEDRSGGGASFRFTLPRGTPPGTLAEVG